MDHFLSGLDGHNAAPWYAARSSVHSQAHEFAVGPNSFQLIPISGSAIPSNSVASSVKGNAGTLDLSTVSTSEGSSGLSLLKASSAASTVASVAAAVAASVPRLDSQIKEEVEIVEEKLGNGLEGYPIGTLKNSKKHKDLFFSGSKWDTKKVCNICGKVLSRGDKLKNHIRIHTNNFPYHCDTCGQGFLRSEGLRIHRRIHTGERPFVCQHCGKSFTRKDKMQRHELIHKVEKPWTCVPCNLEFVRQEGFNAHMEKKHPERLPYTLIQHPRNLATSQTPSPDYHMPEGLATNLTHSALTTAVSEANSKSPSPSTSSDYVNLATNSKSISLLTSRLPGTLLHQP